MKQKIHISMDAKVVEMVNDLAARDGRTFSNMIERIVVKHLQATDAKTEPKQS